jgi:hypothetical protein
MPYSRLVGMDRSQTGKTGELDHMDMDEAIDQTHKEIQEAYVFFTQKREGLVHVIQ